MIKVMTPEHLRSIVTYNAATGVMTSRVARSPVKVGDRLGWLAGNGKSQDVMIDGVTYKIHRLIWLYVYGEWPPVGMLVDHINRNPLDNRLANLRLATNAENARNASLSRRNTSGVKGVTWYQRYRKWAASIRVNRKLVCLGYFASMHEAARAREAAEQKHFGEFAPKTTKGKHHGFPTQAKETDKEIH